MKNTTHTQNTESPFAFKKSRSDRNVVPPPCNERSQIPKRRGRAAGSAAEKAAAPLARASIGPGPHGLALPRDSRAWPGMRTACGMDRPGRGRVAEVAIPYGFSPFRTSATRENGAGRLAPRVDHVRVMESETVRNCRLSLAIRAWRRILPHEVHLVTLVRLSGILRRDLPMRLERPVTNLALYLFIL